MRKMDESLACKCNFIKHLVNIMHLQIKKKNIEGWKSNISFDKNVYGRD